MKPLIVAATTFEIQAIIPLLEQKQIPYLITGVGMTATAYALGKTLALDSSISVVINVGIAGSFDREINLGEVVSIYADSFYELGAEDADDFITIDELGFGKGTFYSKTDANLDLSSYDAITVNRVHGNDASIQKVRKKLPHVKIESMEGAAVFYVCAQENITCMQIRAISNYVEKRDKSLWKIDLAVQNLNNWLTKWIEKNY